jgi:DNA-binding beta-propeller fold protein YncE/uncharacterized membrane protein HdeD (DUF308 family)
MATQNDERSQSQIATPTGPEFEVTCITREPSEIGQGRIVRLGVLIGGKTRILTENQVRRRVEAGERFYVSRAGHKAYLRIAISARRRPYVETIADATTLDNLDALPACGEPIQGWLVLQGLASILLGILLFLLIASPLQSATIALAAFVLIGAYLFTSGLIAIVSLFSSDEPHGVLTTLIGLLGIIAGIVVLMAFSAITGSILPIIIVAILGLVIALLEFVRGYRTRDRAAFVLCVVDILIGLILLILGLATFGIIALGILGLIAGFMMVWFAIPPDQRTSTRVLWGAWAILWLLLLTAGLFVLIIWFISQPPCACPTPPPPPCPCGTPTTPPPSITTTITPTTPPPPITTTVTPPPPTVVHPKGMALDTNNGRLLVGSLATNSDGTNNVVVFKESDMSIEKTIPGFYQPFDLGIIDKQAFVAEVGQIGDPDATGRVGVIDLNTLSRTETITTSGCLQRPTHIAVNPITKRVYVTLDGAGIPPSPTKEGKLAVIDAGTHQVDCLSAGKHPFGVAVSSALNRVYVGDRESKQIRVFDGATNAQVYTITVPTNELGGYAYHLAMSQDGKRLYAAVDTYRDNAPDQLFVFNIAADPPTSLGPVQVGNTYDGGWILESRCSGKIYIAATGLSPDYLPRSNNQRVWVLNHDLSPDKILGPGDGIGSGPFALAENPVLGRIYVGNRGDRDWGGGTLSIIPETACK